MSYRINGKKVTREEFLKDAKGFDCSTFPKIHVTFSQKEYISPLTGKLITSKVERREEMKKFGVREVDPSEYRARREARLNQNGGCNG